MSHITPYFRDNKYTHQGVCIDLVKGFSLDKSMVY